MTMGDKRGLDPSTAEIQLMSSWVAELDLKIADQHARRTNEELVRVSHLGVSVTSLRIREKT
jgi:hypothetical protein